jgi:hypothetical protein
VILLSLVLVLLSLGLLIWGLAGASAALVWASIVASLAAGGCLALAVLRRPRVAAEPAVEVAAAVSGSTGSKTTATAQEAGAASGVPATTGGGAIGGDASGRDASGRDVSGRDVSGRDVSGDGRSAGGTVADPVDEAGPESYPDPPDEPAEEDVSAPTVLKVVDLDAEVVVVDGRPRYHLADCPHLEGRETVPLPVSEARESGFTPCSLCKPDATLTAQAALAALAAKSAQQPAAAPGAEPAHEPTPDEPVDDRPADGGSAAGEPAAGGPGAKTGGA